MKIIIELSHPKHFYQFRYIMNHHQRNGDKIVVLARDKDVLIDLLEANGIEYVIPGKHGKSIFSKLFITPKIIFNYIKTVRKFKPDTILSKASPYAVFAKPFCKAKLAIFPDSEVVKLTNKFVAPQSDLIVTPNNFSVDYGHNHKRVGGFFEETYLAPGAFIPDIQVLKEYGISPNTPFFVLRFIGWSANHDKGEFGFSNQEKENLVELLKPHGKVFITAEKGSVPESLLPYVSKVPAKDIHHLLHFAQLYIGDSQTMATEAALLGTPSLRYNSFVGQHDMSNFKVLENTYGMLKNFNDFSFLMKEANKMLGNPSLKQDFLERRKNYFTDKPDLNHEIIQLLNNLNQEASSTHKSQL